MNEKRKKKNEAREKSCFVYFSQSKQAGSSKQVHWGDKRECDEMGIN
jgi:hypothetical protein